VSAPDVVTVDPDPEVLAKAKRRTFTAEYKLRILDEVDRALTARLPGRVGQILRREGLYSSHLAEWRRDRRQGALASMAEKRRGRKATQRRDEAAVEIARLRKENARLQQRLAQAETIIEVQKKLSVILGIPLKPMELGDSDGSNDDSDGSDE
jgi:transposase-like protein